MVFGCSQDNFEPIPSEEAEMQTGRRHQKIEIVKIHFN